MSSNPIYRFRKGKSWTLENLEPQVDLLGHKERPALLPLAEALMARAPFQEVFMVSAARGRGLPELQQHLLSRSTILQPHTLSVPVLISRSIL